MAVDAQERFAADGFPARGASLAPRRSDVPAVRSPVSASAARFPLRGRLLPVATSASTWASAWASALPVALATEAARGTGLVAFAALFGLGAILYFAAPSEPSLLLLLSPLAASAAAFAIGVAGRMHVVALAVLAVALGAGSGALETWRAGTAMLGAEITTRLTARVVAVEEREGGRARLTLDVLSTERPVLRFAPERVRVTARTVPETLLPGATIAGVVRLLPATGPVRPDGYNFSFHSYFAGIGASGFFLSGPFEAEAIASPRASQRVAAGIERFRERLADHIRGRIGGPEGEIAAALVAGVRGGIAEADNEALRRTGLAHFISISGLHMALVAAIVLVALRSGMAAFPLFASRRPVKKYAAAAALVAICGYIVVSGQEVAAVRSFIMFAVMLVAVLFDRAALTMRNLAISALIILAVAPHEIMGPSFQMSFGATAALIASYAWYTERRRDKRAPHLAEQGAGMRATRAVLTFFGALAATSIIAGLATTVFGIWHFQRVAPLGLVANLAAMPVVSLVVMPSALAGSLLISLGLDGPFFAAMGYGLRLVMDIAHWLSVRSPLDAVGAIPSAALVLLAAALAVATITTTATLRLLAVPLLAAGLASAALRHLPDLLVSEDGRLAALSTVDGRLAVNRARPTGFTTGNWLHATAATGIAGPQKVGADSTADDGASENFRCSPTGLCIAHHASGKRIAHAPNAAAARLACGAAAVIVIDDATAENPCAAGTATVITKRDLALRGSASIWLTAGQPPDVAFAIGPNARAWHGQRRFSREARGLPPYQRRKAAAETSVEPDASPAAEGADTPDQ